MDELKGEINKIKPPTFDGEHQKDEEVETWLLGMRKYFQLHNYSSHAEGRIAIYLIQNRIEKPDKVEKFSKIKVLGMR